MPAMIWITNTVNFPLWLVLLALLFHGCTLLSDVVSNDSSPNLDQDPPPLRTGQAFLYNHQGPRPWGNPNKDVTGLRAIRVVGKSENKKWMRVEEKYEQSDELIVYFIDKDYRLHRQEIHLNNNILRMEYRSPQPLRNIDLKKEKSHTWKYRIDIYQNDQKTGRAKVEEHVNRGYDIRVVTKAGAYLCRHFRTTVDMHAVINKQDRLYTAMIDSYWSDQVSWFIKKNYKFHPGFDKTQGFTPATIAESTILQFQPDDENSLQYEESVNE